MGPGSLRLEVNPGGRSQSRVLAGKLLLPLGLLWPCFEAQAHQGLGCLHSDCGLEVRGWDNSHWLQISISLGVTPWEGL